MINNKETDYLGINIDKELKEKLLYHIHELKENGIRQDETLTSLVERAIKNQIDQDCQEFNISKQENKIKKEHNSSYEAIIEKIRNQKLIEEKNLTNEEILEQLKKEKRILSIKASSIALLSITAGTFNPFYFGFFASAYKPIHRLSQISRIIELVENLLNFINDREIEIFPCLDFSSDYKPLDLLIKFQNKRLLLVSIRSKSKTERRVVYQSGKLYTKHDKKGLREWLPSPLQELNFYEDWITKNQPKLNKKFNLNSNLDLFKALVLWQPMTLEQHEESFYKHLNQQVTAFKPDEKTFIIHESNFQDLVQKLIRAD